MKEGHHKMKYFSEICLFEHISLFFQVRKQYDQIAIFYFHGQITWPAAALIIFCPKEFYWI